MTWPKPTGPAPDFARRCADCPHFGRRRTCLEPHAAGLLPPAAPFGLVWPGLVQAATCPAFAPRQSPGLNLQDRCE